MGESGISFISTRGHGISLTLSLRSLVRDIPWPLVDINDIPLSPITFGPQNVHGRSSRAQWNTTKRSPCPRAMPRTSCQPTAKLVQQFSSFRVLVYYVSTVPVLQGSFPHYFATLTRFPMALIPGPLVYKRWVFATKYCPCRRPWTENARTPRLHMRS